MATAVLPLNGLRSLV
jgi:hypothetical protein